MKLRLQMEVDSLSELYLVSPNTYRFFVKLRDSTGNPLNIPGLPNESTVDVVLTTAAFPFNIDVPVTTGVYTAYQAKALVYKQNDLNCCMKEIIFNLSDPTARLGEDAIGSFVTTVNGRTYTRNLTPSFDILPNADGTITDNTPGIDLSGPVAMLNGRRVYYSIGMHPLSTEDPNVAGKLQNLLFPDKTLSLQQYVVNDAIDSFATFRDQFDGWATNGVNATNVYSFAKIQLSIASSVKQGSAPVPAWLVYTRVANAQKHISTKNWRPYYKFNAIGSRNAKDPAASYKLGGLNTYYQGQDSDPTLHKRTWRTDELPYDVSTPYPHARRRTRAELYDLGYWAAQYHGDDIDALYTDQYEEAMQGIDLGGFYEDCSEAAKGFKQRIIDATSITDVRKMGNYGPYGGDSYHNMFGLGYTGTLQEFTESVGSKIHKGVQAGTRLWSDNDAGFYSSGHYLHRNANWALYFTNRRYFHALDALYANERVKKGTITYAGGGNAFERNVAPFTSSIGESFVQDSGGAANWVELKDIGEVIQYPNGKFLCFKQSQWPAPWDEMFNASFWWNVIGGGTLSWQANQLYGDDVTKVKAFGSDGSMSTAGEFCRWMPNGSSTWSTYIPGVNGAPLNSNNGLIQRSDVINLDAHSAAADVVWEIRDKITTISHIAYTSNRGGYTPVPGSTGLHINGQQHGPLNNNNHNVWYIHNQKKGVALECHGSGGQLYLYQNDYIAPNQFEDVTIGAKSFRAWGRTPVIVHVS